MKYLYRCPECGSDRVQIAMWVNVNTNIPDDDMSCPDHYCLDCEDLVPRLCNVSTSAPFACQECNSTDCPGSRAAQKDALK